jgi:pyrimidine-nucleoside phosphorylase
VGDKTSLVVGPLAAACGVVVPKMSGRGLGITGGTLDKLESIPGLRVNLTEPEILRQVREVGLVIAGQTADLAPADGRLYALRDVTATIESLPLIVSSILSKKLAGGAPSIVLDVKAGRGAFMPSVAAARELARGLVSVGTACGRRVVAYVTNMDQPLGRAVGNVVEVVEAIDTLNGRGPTDLRELALTLASEMVALAGLAAGREAARSLVEEALVAGRARDKLRAMIAAQGGDAGVVDDPGGLPRAPIVETVPSPASGYVADLNPAMVGQTLLELGAGRAKKSDPVDHRVGAIFHRKVGDPVAAGDPLFTLHLVKADTVSTARDRLLGAYRLSEQPTAPPPILVDRVTAAAAG